MFLVCVIDEYVVIMKKWWIKNDDFIVMYRWFGDGSIKRFGWVLIEKCVRICDCIWSGESCDY